MRDSIRLVRKVVILLVLVAALGVVTPPQANAAWPPQRFCSGCWDVGACMNLCDMDNYYRRMECLGYTEEFYYECTDALDQIWFECMQGCFECGFNPCV